MFFYIDEDCLDIFVKKKGEILHDFASFPGQKKIAMTYDEKRWHSAKVVCCLCVETFNKNVENLKILEIIAISRGNIEVLW